MGKKVVTLKDVALKTGVSTSTVSRVLSGKECINPKTRDKILSSIKELQYTPNALARGLKLGQSNMIALIIPSIHNLMFPALTRGVEDIARKYGYMVILCNTDENLSVEKNYIQKLHNNWVDGLLVATMMPNSDHIRKLRNNGFPVVLTSRSYDRDIDAFVIDNVEASYDAVCYLIEQGHRKIAFAMGPDLQIYQERFEGYRKALEDHSIPLEDHLVMHEGDGINSFYSLTKELIQKHGCPDAIFASNDTRAIIIMRALYDFGLKIPDDVAVVGFDNIDFSALVEPPLTTVSQPFYEIGKSATKRLIKQIESVRTTGKLEPPEIHVLQAHLLVRNST